MGKVEKILSEYKVSAIGSLEVVPKPQIRFKGKAQADRESAAYMGYVSIYRRPATQPLGLRWGFETTSKRWLRITAQCSLFSYMMCLFRSRYERTKFQDNLL
jgi:hypothetical protein